MVLLVALPKSIEKKNNERTYEVREIKEERNQNGENEKREEKEIDRSIGRNLNFIIQNTTQHPPNWIKRKKKIRELSESGCVFAFYSFWYENDVR